MIPALVIVGRGRIGSWLAELGLRARVPTLLLGRDDDPAPVTQPNPGRPIVICTRNDDLAGVVADVHPANRADLVFVQNGILGPWLDEVGLGGATQGLLYVAVPRIGARPQPGGESVFSGPWARELTHLLLEGGVPARVAPDAATYRREVAIKFTWTVILGLLGEATGQPVGALARDQRPEIRALCGEIAPVLARALDVSLPPAPLAEAVLAYSASIPDYRAGLKEWRWRNGWLVDAAAAQGAPLPVHTRWLARARRPSDG